MDLLDVKGLPCNLEAERYTLAAVLMDPEAADLLLEGLSEDLFTTERNRLTLRTMKAVHDREGKLDRFLIANRAKQDGNLEAIGGLTALVDLDEGMPRLVNPERYVRVLEEKRALRQVIHAAHDAIQRAALGADEAETIKRELQEGLERAQGPTRMALKDLRDTLTSSGGLDGFFAGQTAQGVPVEFPPLGKMLPVFGRGRVISIGGPTGGGKSTLARQLAIQAARRGFGVALFSLEMSAEEVFRAMCCSAAGVSSRKLQQGETTGEERRRLTEAVQDLESLPLWIADEPNQSISTLQSTLKAERKRRRIDLAIVDYLQLVQSLGKPATRTEAVDGISRALKRMARSLDIPVISLVQWSNEGAKAAQDGLEPGLHSIRESGAIAQDSDVVIFLVPQKPQPGDTSPKRPYRLVVKKNRSGPVGAVEILFEPRLTQFEEVA